VNTPKGEPAVPELIESLEEALENARAFQTIGEHTDSRAYINLDHFYHWYYFPTEHLFAPAKFIAYRGSSIEGYTSHDRHLEEARGVLGQWFEKVGEEDPALLRLVSELEQFLGQHGAHLHEHSRSVTGGVYTPR
jgi:hypothetical protein